MYETFGLSPSSLLNPPPTSLFSSLIHNQIERPDSPSSSQLKKPKIIIKKKELFFSFFKSVSHSLTQFICRLSERRRRGASLIYVLIRCLFCFESITCLCVQVGGGAGERMKLRMIKILYYMY